MTEPPMATLKELKDGTYSLEDVLDMNLMAQWKAEQLRKAQDANN